MPGPSVDTGLRQRLFSFKAERQDTSMPRATQATLPFPQYIQAPHSQCVSPSICVPNVPTASPQYIQTPHSHCIYPSAYTSSSCHISPSICVPHVPSTPPPACVYPKFPPHFPLPHTNPTFPQRFSWGMWTSLSHYLSSGTYVPCTPPHFPLHM